ncbi:MAG: 50S ribosomal protein L4 [Thermodesulfobacteriota bacterium]
MARVTVYNVNKEKVGEVDLNDGVFATEVKPHVIHAVVRMQLANRRAGNACTKTKALVSGGGKKPWRQKGTGRARSGSTRSPLWRKGGTMFGPQPRDYSYQLPKKVRRLALRMALSARLAEENLLVLDAMTLPEIKTKRLVAIMNGLEAGSALVVVPDRDERLEKSARNVPGVKVMPTAGLNVYDVMHYPRLIITQPCIPLLEERLAP